MTLKKKYKQNIEDHFIELHKKLSALQTEHVKKIMNYITHSDTNMTPKPTFETVPVTFESDKEKDTKNILDNNGNLKDTSEFQRSEANRASLEKHISESDKEKVWKNIDGSIVGTKEVTFESDNSWMDCDKCDVNGPCAEHSVDESDKWREVFKRKFTYMGRNQADQLDRQFNPYTHPDEVMECISILLSKERNKVLDEVKKEVESEYFEMNDDFVGAGNVITISSLETILEKLKVK